MLTHCTLTLLLPAGVYPGFAPESLPAVPGLEGMGVVAKNGPGASKFKEGKRTDRGLDFGRQRTAPPAHSTPIPFPCPSWCAGQRVTAAPFPAQSGNGTWQQYICVQEEALLAVPDVVSDEAAAQYFVSRGSRAEKKNLLCPDLNSPSPPLLLPGGPGCR